MEEKIINCQTGERTRRKFTVAEVKQREAEIEVAKRQDIEQQIESVRGELARVAGDLVQVKVLQGSGFVAADIGELERRKTELQDEIAALEQEGQVYHEAAAGGLGGAASGAKSLITRAKDAIIKVFRGH